MKKSYFDTSVLLPALITVHPKYKACSHILEEALQQGEAITTTAHTFAELYSNITKLPYDLSLKPEDALLAIKSYMDNTFTVIELNKNDYKKALERCARLNLLSGVIYDALHLQAAIKAEADALYTSNLRDFQRLWTKDLPFELIGV